MPDRTKWALLGASLLFVLSVAAYVFLRREPRIDEVGGTELEYHLDLGRIEKGRELVAGEAADVIKGRLRAAGFRGATVSVEGYDRLVVRLPGVDPTEIPWLKPLIGTRNALTFCLVAPDEEQEAGRLDRIEEEERSYVAADREWVRRKLAEPDLGESRPKPPDLMVRSESERTESGGLIEIVTKPSTRLALDNRHQRDPGTGEWRPLDFVTGEQLRDVHEALDPITYRPAVAFQFTKEGGERFGELTGSNAGRRLAIVLDDNIVEVATIHDRITDRGQLTGNFSSEDVRNIVTILRSGSLPVRPLLVAERRIEPRGPSQAPAALK